MTKQKNVDKVLEEQPIDEVAQEASQEAPQISIQIDDIIKALNIIDVAIERSAFKARELLEVMPVYQKLLAFSEQVQEAQKKQGE